MVDLTPDMAARKILVAAYCYYVEGESIMSDDEYDLLSVYVSECWNELEPDRKWCCGNAAMTRSSGSHFRFTSIVVASGMKEMRQRGTFPRQNLSWKTREDGCRYVDCNALAS